MKNTRLKTDVLKKANVPVILVVMSLWQVLIFDQLLHLAGIFWYKCIEIINKKILGFMLKKNVRI